MIVQAEPSINIVEIVFTAMAVAGISASAGILMDRKLNRTMNKKISIILTIAPIVCATLMVLTQGVTMAAVKGFLLCLILLWASVMDIKQRKVSDSASLMIMLTALIGTEIQQIPGMLAAMVVIAIPQLAMAVLKPGSYGGADIKISAACAFLLGLWPGLLANIAGLTLAVVTTATGVGLKKIEPKQGIPMVPYMAIGAIIAYLI